MGLDVGTVIVGALVSLVAGSSVLNEELRHLLARLLGKPESSDDQSYSQKIRRLTDSLTKASKEVDLVLRDLANVAQTRESAVNQLEAEVRSLEEREKQIQRRIEDLKSVPIPVAEHFAKLTEAEGKRSALRDYVLFGAGVVGSTIMAILLWAVGIG